MKKMEKTTFICYDSNNNERKEERVFNEFQGTI